jgi:hypothetical protein
MIDVEINVGGRRLLLMGRRDEKRSHMGVGSALKLFSQKNEMMLVELPENENEKVGMEEEQIQWSLCSSMNRNNT